MKSMKIALLMLVVSLCQQGFAVTSENQIELLRRLVSLSSGTNDLSGVSQVQMAAADELKKLGFQIEEFPASTPDIKSKQLVATRLGKTKRFITFVGHADTVFEKLNHFEITKDGNRIKGSGVGDDKGGLVVALGALQDFLKQTPNPANSLRFVISPSEETGSMGFRERLLEYAKDSVLVLGIEPALEDRSLMKAHKGAIWYLIKVSGYEAHAGVNPEAGVNACQQLVQVLDKISALNNFKTGNTLTIGHIEGGKDKYNIVCGDALAKVDFHFVDMKARNEIHHKIEAILKKVTVKSEKLKAEAKIEYQIITEVPPFPALKRSEKSIGQYLQIIGDLEGEKPKAIFTGGAADLNYMSDSSAIMLDGLGPVGGGYHTIDEYIELPTLVSRAQAMTKFLTDFNNQK